ncbi:Rad23 like protein, partial [Thalassiosira pseudonana CCMP1335]
MNLTVKTLKGGKFTVEVEAEKTVAEVKVAIQTNKDLPASSMKLIHSGKVLKDEDKIESCNIKPNDFLVVMIAKVSSWLCTIAKAATPAPTAAAATESTTVAVPATPAAATNPPTPGAPSASTSNAAAASTPAATTAPASSVSSPDEFPAEVIDNLKALGFPESEVRVCLRASNGNPDVAVEFLMNGIPPGIGGGSQPAAATSGGASSSGAGNGGPLDALRSHPQFDDLRRLVQTNPSTLQAVLSQIGQQQPDLLQAINANQAEFLQMMNEPMISAMPQEQVQQYMNMAMQAQVLRLSEEEMAAVDRLTEMGFDRSEAAQAYLACDKNEALAANLL